MKRSALSSDQFTWRNRQFGGLMSTLLRLFIAAITMFLGVAHAAPSETPLMNKRGLRNNPLVGITWDSAGCPQIHTNGVQFLDPEGTASIMDAATDARVRCTRAAANANVAAAKADATVLVAFAGASAVARAGERGEQTFTSSGGDDIVTATGNAALVAASVSGGGSSVAPIMGNLAYSQAAWALTRPVTPVVAAPVAAAPATSAPKAAEAKQVTAADDAATKEAAAAKVAEAKRAAAVARANAAAKAAVESAE